MTQIILIFFILDDFIRCQFFYLENREYQIILKEVSVELSMCCLPSSLLTSPISPINYPCLPSPPPRVQLCLLPGLDEISPLLPHCSSLPIPNKVRISKTLPPPALKINICLCKATGEIHTALIHVLCPSWLAQSNKGWTEGEGPLLGQSSKNKGNHPLRIQLATLGFPFFLCVSALTVHTTATERC